MHPSATDSGPRCRWTDTLLRDCNFTVGELPLRFYYCTECGRENACERAATRPLTPEISLLLGSTTGAFSGGVAASEAFIFISAAKEILTRMEVIPNFFFFFFLMGSLYP